MDIMETSLATTVDKYSGNLNGSIVEMFIKPITSTIFFHTVYSLDGPGTPITVSGQHEELLSSYFYVWLGGKVQMDAADQSVCTKYGGHSERKPIDLK